MGMAGPSGGYSGKHYRNSAAAIFCLIVRFDERPAFFLIEFVRRFALGAWTLSIRLARQARRHATNFKNIS